MRDEVSTVVKVPLAELEQQARSRHGIDFALAEARIEGEFLVLEFAKAPAPTIQPAKVGKRGRTETKAESPAQTRRRRKASRKRMKTRGWEVLTKITNSAGQRAAIYRPFVDALSQSGLTKQQRRDAVIKILRENGNDPTDASIDYYLNNTLEYLTDKGRSNQ